MPIPQLPGVGLNSLDDVINYVIRLERELHFLMEGGLDSTNIFEAGGWRVNPNQMSSLSGQVGMSSAGSAASSIRFWAGNADPTAAPFRVQEDGTMYATNGNFTGTITGSTITGGTVRTAAANNQRIELSSGSFKGMTADNLLSGLVFDPNKATDIVDLFLYHRGTKLVEFFDNITSFTIRGAVGSSGFIVGGNVLTTAAGQWAFSNYTGVLRANGSSEVSAIAGVSGTVYVASASGGAATTAINFTNGVRT